MQYASYNNYSKVNGEEVGKLWGVNVLGVKTLFYDDDVRKYYIVDYKDGMLNILEWLGVIDRTPVDVLEDMVLREIERCARCIDEIDAKQIFYKTELDTWNCMKSGSAYQYNLRFIKYHNSYAKLKTVQTIDRLRWMFPLVHEKKKD